MGDENQTLAALLKDSGYEQGSDFIAKLPKNVKKRVCALKKVQLQSIDVESKFYERVHQLEKEFETEFSKLYEIRRKIVSGEHEPTEEESKIDIIHGLDEEALKTLYENSEPDTADKGITDFWLHVLKSAELISDMIAEHDEPILKFLTDITTSVEVDPNGFSLYFHFAPNPYFTNTVLKKHYHLQTTPDSDDPFEFDGPSVVKAEGDSINWNEGKNITKKVVKKKAKKGANAGKFMTKTVKAESFFNFFDPPQPSEGNEDEDNDDEADIMRADFETGQVLRDHVIPRAVLFFTGEADLGDDFLDYGEDLLQDEDEEEESDEDE